MKLFNTVAGATLIGILVSGCGGGTSSSLPAGNRPVAASAHGVRILGHLNISRGQAATIAAKVRHAGAWALPMKGASMQGHHVRPMTAGAGNDLVNNGGPTMGSASSYNILVNASDESPWGGMISQYQNDMNNSNMIGILSQYTGGGAGSYPVAGDYTVSYDTSTTLQDQDIYNIVYQVASTTGATGYGAIYHVFLQSGVQQCSQNAGGCYAQQYCAYHGNTDFSDIGHVIYSTQPYEDIPGCSVGGGSPNGSTADSTASVLSHEAYEAYTDPDVPQTLAWYNQSAGEIGDICAPASGVPTGVVQLGADNWQIQPEYSNSVHDCSFTP
ncbi:MAG: hypothetical protein ABR584_01560 [Candidatus Baltobacteraceae bacterium]